jgi:hypothetical protein
MAIVESLAEFGPVLSVKLYRMTLSPAPPIPILPCLDHEAMLHGRIPPHIAAYVQDGASGDLHEAVFVCDERRIEIDTVSTWGERSPESDRRLVALLTERFPSYRVVHRGPSWWRGDQRVAESCRAQVSLRAVLLADDLAAVSADIARLQTVSALMEKESRVASWGVRTVTGPLLATAGVLTVVGLGTLHAPLSEAGSLWLRYAVVGGIGAVFLYYGLKAVQLTGMANRVWKRAAEYSLIVAERQRLRRAPAAPPAPTR